jgi:hypothetical protein
LLSLALNHRAKAAPADADAGHSFSRLFFYYSISKLNLGQFSRWFYKLQSIDCVLIYFRIFIGDRIALHGLLAKLVVNYFYLCRRLLLAL